MAKPSLSPMMAQNGEGPSMLSSQELERYARHIVLRDAIMKITKVMRDAGVAAN
jgi:hypothetical protein